MYTMCDSTTFALRHTQISLSGILRHFRPPSRHLLLHTHDTNMEFLHFTSSSCLTKLIQFCETTRAREIDAELKKNKWRNEWLDGGLSPTGPLPRALPLDPTRAWVAPGLLLDIFLFFSKTKIFHSHPWIKDVHGLQSFVSTHSEESDSLLFSLCLQ